MSITPILIRLETPSLLCLRSLSSYTFQMPKSACAPQHISNPVVVNKVSTLNAWTEVMIHTMDTTEEDMSPEANASPAAAIYFLCFIFVGSIMITQLFVAVIIESYSLTQGEHRSEEQQRYNDVFRMVDSMWAGREPLPVRPNGRRRCPHPESPTE